ncbi:MAG: aconitase X swivel domain-containing protein [Halococcoides sp.]
MSDPDETAATAEESATASAADWTVAEGAAITEGTATGEVLRSSEPISFYGAVDLDTGEFVEEGHDLEGECIDDRVLVFPRGKGSTVGSYVLYGVAQNGVGPAAIVLEETETIVATGAILGEIPCVDGLDVPLDSLSDGDRVTVDADAGVVRRVDDAEQDPDR